MKNIMMSRVADMMNHSEVEQLAIHQLSLMALDPYASVDSEADKSSCASSTMSSVSSSSQLRGWGGIVSRKSYACLRTLEAESTRRSLQQQKRRKIQQTPIVGDSWGYFVDTSDR
jgi:hypothetical protein